MGRRLCIVTGLLLIAGCAASPETGPQVILGPSPDSLATNLPPPNYIWVECSGPDGYGRVFESALRVLRVSGFVIANSNRYDGRIESAPRVAPGVCRWLSNGSPDCYERWVATTQSLRHRALLRIQPAGNDGGLFIHVTVLKELEDLPRPIRSTAGAVIDEGENDVERRFEVVDPTQFESDWIPNGRDPALERRILDRLQSCL